VSTFTVVNDDTLAAAIGKSRRRLAYIAPGISETVAAAVGALFERADPPAVTVIIDADPEVCRLGYGTVDGLQRLRALAEEHHLGIRYQSGLRIAVLASDDDFLVYAPTPRLIEAGSLTPSQPNAIVIGADAPAKVLAAAAAEDFQTQLLPSAAEIGRGAVTPEVMDNTLKDLARTPPKRFDVARVERVFNSKLQYVELEITGYKLSVQKVTLPNDLLIGDDPELGKRLRNSFRLLQGDGLSVEIDRLDSQSGEVVLDGQGTPHKEPYSEEHLEADRKKLYDDYLTQVAGYGWLIRRWDRKAFDARVEVFKRKLELYQRAAQQVLDQRMAETIRELATKLLAKMGGELPPRLTKHMLSAQADTEEKIDALTAEIRHAYGDTGRIFNPEIRVRYKDLTYETIQEPRFRSAIERAYNKPGQSSIFARLFEEFDAAPEARLPTMSDEGA